LNVNPSRPIDAGPTGDPDRHQDDLRTAPITEQALNELRLLLIQVFQSLKNGARADGLEPVQHAFHQAGLRDRHARLLLTLAVTGPLTVGELAASMGLASATTSLLAGELDRAGFLNRREDNGDRRRTILSLPHHLREPIEQIANSKADPLRRTLEQLNPTARSHFIDGLRLLAAEATRVEPE
jgi:DNA-binding MarR family transcriptional regulator